MTTLLDMIIDEDEYEYEYEYPNSTTQEPSGLDLDNLPEIILDLSINLSTRLHALNLYYDKNSDDVIEIICRLNGMYQMSGIKVVETYLYEICINSKISTILKLSAAKALIEYEDSSKGVAGRALNHVCNNTTIDVATPCRIEAIQLLMTYTEYKNEANTYFKQFVQDTTIECEFRYKTILNLENIGKRWIQDKLLELFDDKDFVGNFLTLNSLSIKKEFPNFTPGVDNYDFFEMLIQRLSYDKAKELYVGDDCVYDFFICQAQFAFLLHLPNMVYYKILAAQYLLQKCNLKDPSIIEDILLSFAQDVELDYDRRADAADVLLQLGSKDMKLRGRAIIIELGLIEGNVHTVFDNAQNVHTTEVEASVAEVLEFFAILPLHMVQKKPIEFEYVHEQIKDMLKNKNKNKNKNTSLSLSPTEREEKIALSMNRICLDRALYSKYNNTLANILLKVWSYIIGHENEVEMRKRLLEELEDMSGTCSTGFASRLINVISGFGEFNIRISWEDQIIANFSGRLNAMARKIDSTFRNLYLKDMVALWLNLPEQKLVKSKLVRKLMVTPTVMSSVTPTVTPTVMSSVTPSVTPTVTPTVMSVLTMNAVVDEFLSEDRSVKIEICLESFSTSVLEEMSVSSSRSGNRQHFALFFRNSVAAIREEMYQEFTEHLDDASFDLYMRKAIMHYDGEM